MVENFMENKEGGECFRGCGEVEYLTQRVRVGPCPSSVGARMQPSMAIFSSFDSLLLLKRGGQVVFFGPLGFESSCLISYLQSIPGTPHIVEGENPATWMLST